MSNLVAAFIIDTNYLKKNYPGYVDSNIDDNALQQFILIAQDINLQSVIGYNMYNFIITQLMNDPTGAIFSTYYQYILVNSIYKSVALWSIFNAYPTLLYKATNKAIVAKHSEESDAVSIKELEYLRAQIRNSAEFYDARTLEYIKNNPNFFPEYYTTSGVDRIIPKSQVYYGGLYLGGGSNRARTNNGGNGCCGEKGVNLNW
jgi:hypothetical protein